MKASRLSDAQKVFILKQGDDGVPVAEICRKAEISSATYFNWKKKYAGLLPGEMRRLTALDKESGMNVVKMLKRLGAERGTTTIMVTHDGRILKEADRIITLEDGRIVMDTGGA